MGNCEAMAIHTVLSWSSCMPTLVHRYPGLYHISVTPISTYL